MRHLNFNLKDLFSNRKGFVILTSLLRFKNKSREFREYLLQSRSKPISAESIVLHFSYIFSFSHFLIFPLIIALRLFFTNLHSKRHYL